MFHSENDGLTLGTNLQKQSKFFTKLKLKVFKPYLGEYLYKSILITELFDILYITCYYSNIIDMAREVFSTHRVHHYEKNLQGPNYNGYVALVGDIFHLGKRDRFGHSENENIIQANRNLLAYIYLDRIKLKNLVKAVDEALISGVIDDREYTALRLRYYLDDPLRENGETNPISDIARVLQRRSYDPHDQQTIGVPDTWASEIIDRGLKRLRTYSREIPIYGLSDKS